jgi:hypothetical protein
VSAAAHANVTNFARAAAENAQALALAANTPALQRPGVMVTVGGPAPLGGLPHSCLPEQGLGAPGAAHLSTSPAEPTAAAGGAPNPPESDRWKAAKLAQEVQALLPSSAARSAFASLNLGWKLAPLRALRNALLVLNNGAVPMPERKAASASASAGAGSSRADTGAAGITASNGSSGSDVADATASALPLPQPLPVRIPQLGRRDDSFARVVLGEGPLATRRRGEAYMFWCMDRPSAGAGVTLVRGDGAPPPAAAAAQAPLSSAAAGACAQSSAGMALDGAAEPAAAAAARDGSAMDADGSDSDSDGASDASDAAEDGAAAGDEEERDEEEGGGQPVLIAMMAGDAAEWVEHQSDATVTEAVLAALRTLFGPHRVPQPTAAVITRWRADPYARGSYSYLPPQSHGLHYDVMAAPVEGRLFFAGEATNRHHPTTAAGAFDSGVREAVRLGRQWGRSREPEVQRLLEGRARRLASHAAAEGALLMPLYGARQVTPQGVFPDLHLPVAGNQLTPLGPIPEPGTQSRGGAGSAQRQQGAAAKAATKPAQPSRPAAAAVPPVPPRAAAPAPAGAAAATTAAAAATASAVAAARTSLPLSPAQLQLQQLQQQRQQHALLMQQHRAVAAAAAAASAASTVPSAQAGPTAAARPAPAQAAPHSAGMVATPSQLQKLAAVAAAYAIASKPGPAPPTSSAAASGVGAPPAAPAPSASQGSASTSAPAPPAAQHAAAQS